MIESMNHNGVCDLSNKLENLHKSPDKHEHFHNSPRFKQMLKVLHDEKNLSMSGNGA